MMNQAIPEELIVSIDRSDATLAVALLWPATGRLEQSSVSTAPDQLDVWWTALQAAHPQTRLLVAFEQPAPNLLAFFAARPPAALYALNPSATWAYRQSLVVSHARTDQSDAHHQALYVQHHRANLTAWTPPPRTIEQLGRLCEARRKFVDTRTGLTNRLQAVLKRYYPQALQILHEDIWRPLNVAFLRRWPSPQALAKARPATLQRFFHQQGSRSEARWTQRAAVCAALVPLSPQEPMADLLEVSVLLDQLEALNVGVLRYDRQIGALFEACEDAALIRELPGAGPAMAPRLYVAFARYAGRCTDAEAFAAAVGVAPVTDQSGKMRKVYRRLRCDKHTRQSFVEWARESIKHSHWARAFFDQRKAAGHYAQAIFRALAYKWTRILWRCWQTRTPYDETKYLAALRHRGSPLLKSIPESTAQPT